MISENIINEIDIGDTISVTTCDGVYVGFFNGIDISIRQASWFSNEEQRSVCSVHLAFAQAKHFKIPGKKQTFKKKKIKYSRKISSSRIVIIEKRPKYPVFRTYPVVSHEYSYY